MKVVAAFFIVATTLGCSSSTSSTGNGAQDFTCGSIAAPATVPIADIDKAEFTKLTGTEIPAGRWVLTAVVAQSPLGEHADWVGRKIGLAIEFADGSKYTAVTVDSNGAVARSNGTYAISASGVDFTPGCEPDKIPDGTAPDVGVTNSQFQIDGTTMTLNGYVTENKSTASSSSLSAVPMTMTLTRQ